MSKQKVMSKTEQRAIIVEGFRSHERNAVDYLRDKVWYKTRKVEVLVVSCQGTWHEEPKISACVTAPQSVILELMTFPGWREWEGRVYRDWSISDPKLAWREIKKIAKHIRAHQVSFEYIN